MLVTGKKLLANANKGRYAVGAFNVNNMEIIQAIVCAAEKLKSPAILQTSEGAIGYAGLETIFSMLNQAANSSPAPLAIHLDHGRNLDLIRKCIKIGYTSIMYDGSHLPFEKNVKTTKKVVSWCHKKGIGVEAELGTIGGAEDLVSARQIIYTEPAAAVEFVEKTGCDALAIAIGTSHGAYKFAGTAHLDIGRLIVIKKLLPMPLVLHGASGVPEDVVRKAQHFGARLGDPEGVPDEQISRAIRHGINKINTDTDLRLAFTASVRETIATRPEEFDPRKLLAPAREAIQAVVEHRMRLFGSAGKA